MKKNSSSKNPESFVLFLLDLCLCLCLGLCLCLDLATFLLLYLAAGFLRECLDFRWCVLELSSSLGLILVLRREVLGFVFSFDSQWEDFESEFSPLWEVSWLKFGFFFFFFFSVPFFGFPFLFLFLFLFCFFWYSRSPLLIAISSGEALDFCNTLIVF